MTYRLAILLASAAGALPAAAFVVLFVVVDRPRYRDRYAGLIAGIGVLAFVGFAIPLTLAVLVPPSVPSRWWQWALSVGLRGVTAAYMWWLLYVYRTPGRARTQLTRYEPPREPDG